MKLKHIVLPIVAASSFAALGQPANPFLGNWKVTWGGGKHEREAVLVITEDGGSWRKLSGSKIGVSKMNPCDGREAPISIESSSAKKIVMKVKLSEAYAGCSDSKVVLLRADDGTITGKHGQSELTVSRR